MDASRSDRTRRIARASDLVRASLAVTLGAASLGVSTLAPRSMQAQGETRSIAGRISRPGPSPAGRGVGGAWVILHRVGADSAAPLDSLRTAPDGSYRFAYRTFGDSNAVYFVSTSRGGVNYFTPPVRERVLRGGAADLVVFDTTSAPIPITVRGRHLILTVPDSSGRRMRTVVEAFELSNDSSVTRVARGAGGSTFEAALPPGVTAVQAGQGDVSADALIARDGRLVVNAPLSPGLRQLSFSYEVRGDVDPLELLVESPTTVLEVLVEEPTAMVSGAGLVAVDPVEIDGRLFKRFLAQEVAAAQVFAIRVPPPAASRGLRMMLIVTAVGAAMLMGLGMVVLRRGPGLARRRDDDPEALALEAAALDAAYERLASPTEQQKAEHYVARARIKGRLAAALAKRDGLS